ncbi:hypothetical protein BS329_02870 [Amycolatopsis coloradensis]|uniref:Uncharacterized protein n=1 Tax=Amycolatopsis coloradensis TaxID=76021 RepID=A0A1R0L2K4_9PSEU|nr:hypothetical protein [Amycolatopsis coloradensis]OLZ56580.1 hypothetical protein BS329_02870 [Amycolatopsis coloradensis]
MQPNSPQPGFPPGGPAPWGGAPGVPTPRPKPRANAAAAMIAGVLALLTAAMLVWFVLYNVVHAGGAGHWSGVEVQNVVFGVISSGALVVAAGFTFARRISGAWTLCGLCALSAVAMVVAAPLVWGTPLGAQLKWIFSFDKSNGVAIALAVIFAVLTASVALIAGSVWSYEKARG